MTEYEQDTRELYIDLMKKALTASIYPESGWNIPPPSNVFRRLLFTLLSRKSLVLVKRKPFNDVLRREGRDWPFFGYTMVGHFRLDNLQMCVEDVLRNRIPGDFIETGAGGGGNSNFYASAIESLRGNISERYGWLILRGMPKAKNKDDGADLSQNDYLKVSLDQVRSNFRKFGLLGRTSGVS